MTVHDDLAQVDAIVARARAAQARYEAECSQHRYDQAAQAAESDAHHAVAVERLVGLGLDWGVADRADDVDGIPAKVHNVERN